MASDTVKEKLEKLYLEPAAEITEDNTYEDPDTETFQFDDKAALKLVLDDSQRIDSYMVINQWASGWTLASTLYQSPQSQSAFDGGNVGQANVPKFMVSNHISSIVPKLMSGIFYEDPPFLLRPGPNTPQEIVRGKTALFSAQLWDMKFEEESERSLDQMALLGTCIMKWGYSDYTVKEKKYVRNADKLKLTDPVSGEVTEVDTPESDEFEVKYVDKRVSQPWIKYCDIRTVLVDIGCRFGDIRKARHVIYRDFATYEDLDHLRGVEGYDIPEEDVLRELFVSGPSTGVDNITMTIPEGMRGYLQQAVPRNFKTTSDPYQNGIEILERWDCEKVIVVLSANGHNILIRNEANPYGKLPFLSANWRNIQDSFYGQGLGLLIGSEQLVEQGITNLSLDLMAYGLQPTAVRKKGFNTPTQSVRWKLGGIIDVDDDVERAFKFLEMPAIPPEAWNCIQHAQSSAAATSGANEQVVQGASSAGAQSTGMRSATGAAAVIQANASRLDGPDGRFIRQIFEPWLDIMDELNNQLLPTSVLKQVLGEKLGSSYKVDHIDFRNANLDYEVLAGAKLGAKKEMAQALPLLMQLLNNPTFADNLANSGMKFDAFAIFKAFTDAAGWKFSQSFVVPMTPEEKQQHDANTPSALQQKQLAAKQQSDLQKFQEAKELEDQKVLGHAGAEVLRQATEKALTSEAVEGTPGNSGFGSTTVL